MTKERAGKAAEYVQELFWCFTSSRMTRDQVNRLAALLADEPEPPPAPPEPVYRTAEELAAAIASLRYDRQSDPVNWGVFNADVLWHLLRYKREVK